MRRTTKISLMLCVTTVTACDDETEGFYDIDPEQIEDRAYAACGTKLAAIDNIWAYSNGVHTGTGNSCGGSTPAGALLYQCVEYAQRYMRAKFGTPEIWPVAVAAEMCQSGKYPNNTTRYWQGSGYKPVKGDLAVWTDNNYGHVAVVRQSTADGIEIVEQNSSAAGYRWLWGNPSGGYWSEWNSSPDCFIHANANTGGGGQPPPPPPSNKATCDQLGYTGACYGDVSAWAENNQCKVRDCGSEGKTCGWISNTVGWGCLGGSGGASTINCSTLDYEGTCMDDTLVYVEGGKCKLVDCDTKGKSCGWDGGNGYNCVD